MIPEKDVQETCRMGQGAECCKYLTIGSGWFCAKTHPGLKRMIDAKVDMKAKGDNCNGYQNEIDEFVPIKPATSPVQVGGGE